MFSSRRKSRLTDTPYQEVSDEAFGDPSFPAGCDGHRCRGRRAVRSRTSSRERTSRCRRPNRRPIRRSAGAVHRHLLRDVTGIGVAAGVLFAVGLAVESGPAVAVGLIGVLFVAVLVPFIVIY